LLDQATWRQASREPNVLERDVFLKRALGFDEANFTRLAELLEEA
jgi:hypothetical protein